MSHFAIISYNFVEERFAGILLSERNKAKCFNTAGDVVTSQWKNEQLLLFTDWCVMSWRDLTTRTFVYIAKILGRNVMTVMFASTPVMFLL